MPKTYQRSPYNWAFHCQEPLSEFKYECYGCKTKAMWERIREVPKLANLRELSFFTGRGGRLFVIVGHQFFLVPPPWHAQKNSGPPLGIRKKILVPPPLASAKKFWPPPS